MCVPNELEKRYPLEPYQMRIIKPYHISLSCIQNQSNIVGPNKFFRTKKIPGVKLGFIYSQSPANLKFD